MVCIPKGIGAATVQRLSKEGLIVVGVDLPTPSVKDDLQRVVEGVGGVAVTEDITSEGMFPWW